MSFLRFFAPSFSTLFGLYCLTWSLLAAASNAVTYRAGGALFGVFWLLLALVYLRVNQPTQLPAVE